MRRGFNARKEATLRVSMKQFVPISDEMLYRVGGPPLPLVPYRTGVPCRRQLREEVAAPRPIEPAPRADPAPLSAAPSARPLG
jgi:hypothetical protein